MPSAVMPDVHGDGASLGIAMVKKSGLFYVIQVIKDVCGRRARAERIFESPIVLEVYQITTVTYIYIQLRNNRINIKSNVMHDGSMPIK